MSRDPLLTSRLSPMPYAADEASLRHWSPGDTIGDPTGGPLEVVAAVDLLDGARWALHLDGGDLLIEGTDGEWTRHGTDGSLVVPPPVAIEGIWIEAACSAGGAA
jgi:hypothetical protein